MELALDRVDNVLGSRLDGGSGGGLGSGLGDDGRGGLDTVDANQFRLEDCSNAESVRDARNGGLRWEKSTYSMLTQQEWGPWHAGRSPWQEEL